MHSAPVRVAALVTCLLLTLPMAAGAAELDEFVAEASTTSVQLSVFPDQTGGPLLDLVGTDASASSDPSAAAAIDAITVLGESLVGVESVSSTGEAKGGDEECVVPAAADGLGLSAICSLVAADAGPLTEAKALADAQLLEVGVTGSFLTGALAEPLDTAVAAATDVLTTTAADAYIAECNEILADVPASQITESASDLFAMLPDDVKVITDEASTAADTADPDGYCTAVYNLTLEQVAQEDLAASVQAVLDALADATVLTLELDGATSQAAGDDAGLDVTAKQVTLTISGAEVDLSGVVGAIDALVAQIQAEVEDIAGGPDPADPLPLPTDTDLSAVFEAIPLYAIDGPLLTGTISGGVATTAIDTDGATTADGTAPFAELAIAPGLLKLLGQDPESGEVSLSAGQSQTLAEGTPLESSIEVGTLTTEDDVAFGDTDLVGSTAATSATTVSLLGGIEGGITLVLAAASAGAYSSTVAPAAPAPTPDLPHTGGGAAAAAVLALGAAAALRRRRD